MWSRLGGSILALSCAAALALVGSGPTALAVRGPNVVISELMINPQRLYDSRGEWIELFNAGDQATNLAGWTLSDNARDQLVLPSMDIAPGQYLVLSRLGDSFANGGVSPRFVYGNAIVLNEVDDRLILRDANSTERDRVDWSSGFTVPEGASLSLADPTSDNSGGKNWCAAVSVMRRGDLGSPGATNRCEPSTGPLVITEIMQNPGLTADERGEYFEVYNPGDQPVDMTGYTVKDDDFDSFTIATAVVVPAKGYSVFASKLTANGQLKPDYVYGSGMVLQNDTDELVIADRDLVQIDRVRWDNGKTFPDPDGASMSLRDSSLDNSVGVNWCASTNSWSAGDSGTPGSASWCLDADQQPIVITEVMFDPRVPASERKAEWFEVANLGNAPVDMAGWTITGGDFKTQTIWSLVVAPGAHAVLAANGDRATNGDVAADYVYGTGVPLYNSKGRVVLKSRTGSVIDRVEWSAAAGFPLPTGRSISLGVLSSDNALGANWCESNSPFGAGDFGSPGADNSCEKPLPPPSVVISEVMRNPAAVGDISGEWFELHNTTSAPVSLSGWTLTDGASDRHVITGSLVVPADGYLVLGRSTDRDRNGGAPVAYSYGSGFVLSNATDAIIVSDQHGQRVDEVRWQANVEPRPNGASIALVNGAWCVSRPQFGRGDRGTPGTTNDCTQHPHLGVVINEVHIDPKAISDTVGEWIELYNAGAEAVDLNGWVLRDDDYDALTITSTKPLTLEPGKTFVLGRDTVVLNGGAPVDYAYGSAFPLVENADEINLYDAALIPVDRVAWTPTAQLPHAVGASAALRTPTSDNSVASNWCTSVANYGSLGEHGTPGAANTCELTAPTTTTEAPTTTAPATTAVSGPTILSLSDPSCGSGMQMSGSHVTITGDVRGNGDVNFSGGSASISGTISYGGSSNIGRGVSSAGIVHSAAEVASDLPWAITDFAPGGRYSSLEGYVFHPDDLVLSKANLAPGVHFVAGDVTIPGSSPVLTGVTIVATGQITISGNTTMTPAAAELPTLLAGGGSCWLNAIHLSGSHVAWTGVIAAPGGAIQISSADVSGGRVVGSNVQMSGANITLG